MNKNKQLEELFIEDLGQVNGGYHGPGRFTTMALGEEGHGTEFGQFPFPLQRPGPGAGGDSIFLTAGNQVTVD